MGTITLISDTWENLPEVEIVSGLNAPDEGNQISLSNVELGWTSQEFEDRVCYRRSNDPSRVGSGLTSWNCISRPTSGSETASLS